MPAACGDDPKKSQSTAAPALPPGLASSNVKFDGVSGDTIEIVAPSPLRPKAMAAKRTASRVLGAGLVALKIQG